MAEPQQVYLAVDLGASSGRVLAGLFDGRRLQLDEVYRFENGAIHAGGRMYWDVLALWKHIQQGLHAAGGRYGDEVVSIGVDTWGVDFALLGRGDELLGNPRHYRDSRTAGIFDKAFPIVSREEIFAETGLQFIEFNTLFQLLAMKLENSPLLDAAETLLMMPDVFNWLLTGEKANELTDASTTQFYNPQTKDWARSLFDRFGLPTNILGRLAAPGERLGKLRRDVAAETGLSQAAVVLPGAHDTASAVMAVPAAGDPAEKPDWCYISSGTWSLMGVETPRPVVTEKCRELNFTNEAGVGGTTRLLKNIAGLWLVQECRRVWNQAGADFDWDDLVTQAANSPPLESIIDPDNAAFNAPRDMPLAIRDFCSKTGQTVPGDEGAVVRCALESLALRYRAVLNWSEELTGARIETIHIVGGGTQNRLLSQMAADACNRRVVAGPVEATAVGNVMMQAVAGGQVGSIREARDVVRNSFDVEEFTPREPGPWDEAFSRFEHLREG